MSDRQQSEEPEEQVDLEGDDDDGYRRRRDDSEEPEEEEEENEEGQDEGDVDGDGRGKDDAGMGADGEEPAAGGGGGGAGDKMDKEGADGPEDDEEKKKWDELLALPPHGSEVFIGGLPRDITEEDLRELCEPLGEIYEVRLTKDKDTKENKGFAFVTFTDKDAAQRAIEDVQDREYKGRTLRCSLSQAKHRLFVGNVPKGLSSSFQCCWNSFWSKCSICPSYQITVYRSPNLQIRRNFLLPPDYNVQSPISDEQKNVLKNHENKNKAKMLPLIY